jgi:hypothetical protein
MPPLEYWFSGTAWVAAIAFVIAVINFFVEVRKLISAGHVQHFKLLLSIALLISVLLAWWAAAVQESRGPRHLTKKQVKELTKAAPELCPDVPINVATNLMDAEAREYAKEFVEVLNKSGCISELNQSINPVGDLMGAHIGVRKDIHQGARELYKLFQKARIDIKPDLLLRETDLAEHPFVLAIGAKPRD